jgi:hypothetical protein
VAALGRILDREGLVTAAAGKGPTADEAALRNAMNTTTAAAAGVRDGPSPVEPIYASATDAGREAAATARDMATAAAAGVRGRTEPV